MQYNPQYCTIVVRNTDGSGYLRQFKTLAEAKDAYSSISDSEASVYLYQPPTKSLASFDALEGIPDYNNGITYGTGDKVKFQGKVYQLINFIGAAGYDPAAYANLWTEVTSFTPPSIPPISSTASPVVENGVTRNPFAFNQEENSSSTKMTKIGCEIVQELEADGNLTPCAIYPKYRFTLQDGTIISEELGEKNTNGCYYPAGFKIKFLSFGESFREIKILNSLDFGGTVYGPYYQVDTYMGSENAYEVADGSGGNVTQVFISVRKKEGDLYVDHYFQDGDTPYKTSDASFSSGIWMEAGQPIPNGDYLVTYKVTGDEKIYSGIWSVSIENADSYPSGKWVFTPQEPDQPPPPPCSILRKVTNPITGNIEDECDPDIVYPFTVEENCEPPVTVDLEGQTITLGTNKKKGMDNGYGDVVWGPCSGMIYVPNATLILSGESLNYFSDGQGSYYTEDKDPNPCDSAGTIISSEQTDITVQINGSTYTIGYSYERTVADGNCGSSLEIGSEYVPSGTEITQDETNIYYSDGAGGYYAEPIVNCDPYGTFVSSSNTGSVTVYVSELSGDFVVGETVENTYADGNCGTYTESGSNYYSYGTQIASDSTNNYLSDGAGGYYSEPIVNCDAYGTFVSSSNSGSVTVYVSELNADYIVGEAVENTYADGNCGTYTESVTNWYSYGTQIASDSSNNYLSNGNGGYYSEPITGCDSYGTYISGENTGDLTVYVSELSNGYTVGNSYNNTYADGNCGTYTESGNNYYSYGTQIASDGTNYNYFSDGAGGYYAEPITSCDSAGTYISSNSGNSEVYISEIGSYYVIGTYSENIYADGNCGTYGESNNEWYPYGTNITNANGYNFFSNGSGGYYSESDGTGGCDSYGTYISGTESGSSVYISELGAEYVVGTSYDNVYADGNCGTYTESGTNWYTYGTLIANGNGYNFYSNGEGNYYAESDGSGGGGDGGGGDCTSSGTLVSEDNTNATIYIGELGGDYVAGTNYSNTYADGTCGTYNETGTNWYSYGTEIASDSAYRYLSDGNGSYYSESINSGGDNGGDNGGGGGDPDTSADGQYNYPIDDDSVEDTGVQNSIEYNGSGVNEATFYDESANPYTYESYDIESGDVVFSAGAPQPAHGDWFRNAYGHIASTGRNPRFHQTAIPNGWRSTRAYEISGGVPSLKGATSIQVQVGWTYTGRKRWHSGHQKWIPDSFFPNSQDLGGVTAADGALIPAGVQCQLPSISSAGPKTFYAVTDNPAYPSTTKTEPYLFEDKNNYYAVSNGDGTAVFQQII